MAAPSRVVNWGPSAYKAASRGLFRFPPMSLFYICFKGLRRIAVAGATACAVAAALPTLAADGAAADNVPEQGFDGEIALGGSLATGNTSREAFDLDTKLNHRDGRREDRFKFTGDLAREAHNTRPRAFKWAPRATSILATVSTS